MFEILPKEYFCGDFDQFETFFLFQKNLVLLPAEEVTTPQHPATRTPITSRRTSPPRVTMSHRRRPIAPVVWQAQAADT